MKILAFEECWKRFPDYELDLSRAERVHSLNVRGFSRWLVKL